MSSQIGQKSTKKKSNEQKKYRRKLPIFVAHLSEMSYIKYSTTQERNSSVDKKEKTLYVAVKERTLPSGRRVIVAQLQKYDKIKDLEDVSEAELTNTVELYELEDDERIEFFVIK